MNTSKTLASIFTIALIVLSTLSILAIPVQAVTTQTVDLSAEISGQATTISYDSANGVAWVSVGVSVSHLYKINLATVLTSPSTSVTDFGSPFPFSSGGGGVGNLAGGPIGNLVLKGLVWSTARYNSGNAIASLNPETSATAVYYYPSSNTDFGVLATDGTLLYTTNAQTIVVFNPSSGAFTTISTAPCTPNFLFIDGSTIWFNCQSPYGLGSVNTDGSGLSVLNAGHEAAYSVKDGSGNIWLTSNEDHLLIKYDGSTFTPYSTGMTSDGPYGILIDISRNGIWLSGFLNKNIRFFSLTTSSIDVTKDISTSKKPYNGFVDSGGNIWNMALGSTDLIRIAAPISTTTTTSTITSGTSTITTTYVTEATSSTATTDASGCIIGTQCAGSWTPIVIPTIHVSSIDRLGTCDVNGVCRDADTVIISGFEFFLAGPSVGDFLQWAYLIGCCWMQLSNLNPSNGTFASLSVTATPYAPNWYSPTPASVMNASLSPTSETSFGWLCRPDAGGKKPNIEYIVQYAWDCQGSSNPVNYRTFSFTAPIHTIVQIQATGTASQGQVSVYNIFT